MNAVGDRVAFIYDLPTNSPVDIKMGLNYSSLQLPYVRFQQIIKVLLIFDFTSQLEDRPSVIKIDSQPIIARTNHFLDSRLDYA